MSLRKRVEIYAENSAGPLKPPVSELPLPQDAGTTVPALPEGTLPPDKEAAFAREGALVF